MTKSEARRAAAKCMFDITKELPYLTESKDEEIILKIIYKNLLHPQIECEAFEYFYQFEESKLEKRLA